MTEVQALFVILAAIYLLQCIVWLPQDCLAFRRNLRGRWSPGAAALALEALKLRGVFANPLPPLPAVIASAPTSVFVSPKGVAAEALKTETFAAPQLAFVSFDQVRSVRAEGKNLILNDEPFAALMSPAASRHAAELVAKIKKTPASARAAAIAARFRGMFNSDSIADRLAGHREHTRLLRLACNLLFALLFLVSPALVWQFGLLAIWPYLLGALLFYMAVITWAFARAHKALHPDAASERFNDTLSVALSPPAAVRANDALMKELLRDFHPLAVASVLLPAPAFTAFASQAFRDLSFPKPGETDTDADLARRWWHTSELAALRTFLPKNGIDPAQLLGPPPRQADCNSYCPRCWSQYMQRDGVCKECGDLELSHFSEESIGEPVPIR